MGPPPRYLPEIPFPPYRHLPGQTPHPNKHPDGHSYATEEYAGPPLTADNWRTNAAYLYGVDLFNHGYWWEAHEAWEGVWQLAEKESSSRAFLQGLIQTAAALVKRRGGNTGGAGRLWGKAREKLERVGGQEPVYMGLEVAVFIEVVESLLAADNSSAGPWLRLI